MLFIGPQGLYSLCACGVVFMFCIYKNPFSQCHLGDSDVSVNKSVYI